MAWHDQLNGNSISWLLEENEPAIRYLAMRDLQDLPVDDNDLITAHSTAHKTGQIATLLSKMQDTGYWVEPGPGYSPKYRGSVWSVITLAQIGASCLLDQRIKTACQYLVDHALTEYGQFNTSGTPSTTADCLQGNLCSAMLDLEFEDSRLEKAFEWMARSVTGEGIAPIGSKDTPMRYYSGKCGPGFACGANNKLPCAWGAVKVMSAFSKLPKERHTPAIKKAIKQGINFLLSVDPASAEYPTGYSDKPSGNWWKFGFPVFYVTDLLQNTEALIRLGLGNDKRISNALSFIKQKQDPNGRWTLDYDYAGKTWLDFGEKKQPNKWVTLRAARVIKLANQPQ